MDLRTKFHFNPNTSASRSNRRIIRINKESIINLNDPSTLSLSNRRPFSKIQLSCHKHRSKGNYLGYELLLLLRNPFAYRERLLDIHGASVVRAMIHGAPDASESARPLIMHNSTIVARGAECVSLVLRYVNERRPVYNENEKLFSREEIQAREKLCCSLIDEVK